MIDITQLRNISSGAIENAYTNSTAGVSASEDTTSAFSTILDSALSNINETNSYLSDAENEELKLSMGLTDNTHDLTIALQKANTALQYTVAIRDKFLDAYKEIMNINI